MENITPVPNPATTEQISLDNSPSNGGTIEIGGLTFTDPITKSTEGDPEVPKVEEPAPQAIPVVTPAPKTEEAPAVETDTKLPPTRRADESDAQFNLRTELYHAYTAAEQAETPEEKSVIKKHMAQIRRDLGNVSTKAPLQTNTVPPVVESDSEYSPEDVANIKLGLEKLGYKSMEDIDKIIEAKLSEKEYATAQVEHDKVINTFYETRKDIAIDPRKMQALENYVLENFNISQKTSPRQMQAAMEMASDYLFPKSTEAKRAAATNSQAKVDAFNYTPNSSGNTTAPAKKGVEDSTATMLRDYGFSDEDLSKFKY